MLSRPEGDTTEEVDCERRANPDAGPSDDGDASCSALYSEVYGVEGMSHLEEEAHLQMVFSLLGAGENVEREIEAAVDEVIAANPAQVEKAKQNPKLAGWFVGQVMKSSGGKVNPQAVNDLLKAKLGI